MGFPFKLLDVASLRVFFILFPRPLPVVYSPGIESCERTYDTQSEQSLCTHTWEFVEMTDYNMPSSP